MLFNFSLILLLALPATAQTIDESESDNAGAEIVPEITATEIEKEAIMQTPEWDNVYLDWGLGQ
jgi:hypothetical protein